MQSKYSSSSNEVERQNKDRKQNKKTTGRENRKTKKPRNKTETENTPLPYIPNYPTQNQTNTKQNKSK